MGGVFTCLLLSPKHIPIQKLESRNPDNIDKEVFFKFLVIPKDITNTNGQILKLKVSNIFLFRGILTPNLILKTTQKFESPLL